MFVSLIVVLLPDHGQASSLVEKERVKAYFLSEQQQKNDCEEQVLKELEKPVAGPGSSMEGKGSDLPMCVKNILQKLTGSDEEKKKGARERVKRETDQLEKVSQDQYHLPAKEALLHMEKMQLYINRYTDLTEQISKTDDSTKKGRLEAQRDGVEALIRDQVKEVDARIELEKLIETRFRGFGFGIALGAVIDVGGRDRIESAILDPTGRVRVEEDSNVRANFMLESHFFFTPEFKFPFGFIPCENLKNVFGWVETGNWGFGPFVAIQPGSNNIIDSVGVGGMVGFKRPKSIGGSAPLGVGDSFNIGVGALIDIKQKVLGDGVRANEPLPAGETALRFKETSQIGAVVIFSYSFY